MKLIKFPLPNVTNNSNKANISLPYQEWEIEQIIENLSEGEQDLLIERIAALVQEWELTLDVELELSLQTKYKDSKTSLGYTDWLYDLAQEEVYRAYAIEQLDKQKNKISIAQKANHQSLVGSNNCTNIRPIISSTPNTQTVAATPTTTATTPTDSVTTAITNSIDNLVDRNALTNKPNIDSNSPLNQEELINQIIENLSEVQQDVLMEKIVILMEQWELTKDEGLKLALGIQHQKHQPNIAYQDFLYELAQSQVYREYAIEQIELAKQSSFAFIEPFTQIEKVYCDQLTNIDEFTFDESIFDDASQSVKDNADVHLLDTNNHTINNDGLATSSNSDIFIREEPVFDDVSPSAKENAGVQFVDVSNDIAVIDINDESFSNKISLDCHQTISNSQGHQEILTSLKDCANHHITKGLSIQCRKFPITYINEQSSNFALANYSWKNSPSLTKAKKALLMHVHQGKLANFYHPASLPP